MAKAQALPIFDNDYLDVALKVLDRANSSVDLLAYSFAIGSAGGKLSESGAPFRIAEKLASLKKKHGKNLKVRVYLEGERDTAARNAVTARFLKKVGCQVHFGATHAKGLCVDKKYVLFGSTNLTNQSMVKNNEANLFFQSKNIADGFGEYFDHLWKGGAHGEVELPLPLLADGAFKDELIDLIDQAQNRIDFSIYFFHQKEIEAALIRAHKRKVKVTGFVHQHASFALSYIRRNFATVKRLREAGIKGIHFSQPHTFSHSKYLVIDQKEFALGTGNWLDEDVKVHPQLYVRLKDPATAKALVKHVATQIKSRSAEPLWSS